MVDFDELLESWRAADYAACEAELVVRAALDRHVQGLAAPPPSQAVAAARRKRQLAHRLLADLYVALRETRCSVPLL